jgi:hypothetical protein
MISFIFEVIVVSIIIASISYALKLVPKYPKKLHRILVQILNTAFLTLLLTYLIVNAIDPGWVVLGSLIFMCLFLAIIVTNVIAKTRQNQRPSLPGERPE